MQVILEIKNIRRSYFADIYIKFYIYIYISSLVLIHTFKTF